MNLGLSSLLNDPTPSDPDSNAKVGGVMIRGLAPAEAGSFWTIDNFHKSGLQSFREDPSEVVHYVRQETKKLWNYLEEIRTGCTRKKHRLLCVVGDPGSGKSSTVFGYCQYFACLSTTESPVVWVTQTRTSFWLTTIDHRTNAVEVQRFKLSEFEAIIQAIVGKHPALVCLDGINPLSASQVSYEYFVAHLLESLVVECYLVVCSSLQKVTLFKTEFNEAELNLMRVCGWSVDDMLSARKAAVRSNQPIFPQELLDPNDDSAFRKKLHLAGGNMRFITKRYVELVIELDGILEAIKLDAVWESASGHSDTYNRLFIHSSPGVQHFVSAYISQEISKRTTLDAIDKAAALDPGNNGYQGILFEIRGRRIFQDAIRHHAQVIFTKTNMSFPEKFKIVKDVDYFECEGDGPASTELTTVLYTPAKGNQGCFDFVIIRIARGLFGRLKYHVYFLQYTVSDHHKILFTYAARFLRHMFPNNLPPRFETRQQAKRIRLFEEQQDESVDLLDQVYSPTGDESPVRVVSMDIFPKVDIQVHFYFVLPSRLVKDFKLSACEIDSIESVQNFDPKFNASKIRVSYISSHPA